MADDADRAQELQDLALAHSLSRREHSTLAKTGFCYNCKEPLSNGGLFCDSHCEQDYRKLRRMRDQRIE